MDDQGNEGPTGLAPIENLRVWLQEFHDSERTIMCSPEWESRIKTMVAMSPCAGLWTVTVQPWMSDDQVYVMDHNAMEAASRQAMQRIRNTPIQFFDYSKSTPLTERYLSMRYGQGVPRPLWGGPAN